MFYSDLVSLSSEAAGVTRLVSQRREGGMGGATAVSTRQQQQQHFNVAGGCSGNQSGAWWVAKIRLSMEED